MSEVKFVDTTLRDGDQSVWGCRLTTEMLLSVASRMDDVGFEAIEAESSHQIKMRVLQRKECPWARLRILAKKVTKTPLTMITGPAFGRFDAPVPLAIAKLRAERLAANGLNRVQINGIMNDFQFMIPELVRYSREAGLEVVIGLIFAISPKHTDEYYAKKTLEAAALKPARIYLKDPMGLLTPDRARTLMPAILQNCGDIPLELHGHGTLGLAPLCYLEALKAGVKIFHTAIPPLANGSGQPSVLNILSNAALMGHTSEVDEELIKEISDHLHVIARREGLPLGIPLEYDHSQLLHQIPGGVIANLKRQLTEIGIGHRLGEVLEETIQVRKDLGYPMMYTPYSQFVVTQAAMNVISGERYKEVADEMILYVLGYWGQETISGLEDGIKSIILDRPRGEYLAKQPKDEPTIDDIRQQLGASLSSDDDLLMGYMMGGVDPLVGLRSAESMSEYPSTRSPLPWFIQTALKQKSDRWRYIKVEKGDVRLVMSRV